MKTIDTPFLGANDTEATFLEWEVDSGARVVSGTVVASVETTKSVIDVTVDQGGYLYHLVGAGDCVTPGQALALVADDPVEDVEATLKALRAETGQNDAQVRVTKKAEIVMRREGIEADAVRRQLGDDVATIDEAAVRDYIARARVNQRRYGMEDIQRVAIIGGAGGGGALIIIDSLMRSPDQRPVCIFDQNETLHGRAVMGVPVVGSLDLLGRMLEEGRIDAVVIAFNRDLRERAALFEKLSADGVPFCNVIDHAADIRSMVEIGTGNVILGHVYVGACSRIGDNNFISANVRLEHGNVLGDTNAFGPGVFTSGNVTIGNGVRFATGIFVEPEVTVNDGAVIASGSVLTVDVPAGSVVKGSRRS